MTSPKIFISYAHSSTEHKQDVMNLAAALRSNGLTVIIDTDVRTPQGPEEGWPKWMKRQLKEADWVLMFFDRKYRRRFDGEELPDKGLGATWEGAIITSRYYREATINTKFIPLLADGSAVELLPDEFFGYNYYYIPTQSIELAIALRSTPEAHETHRGGANPPGACPLAGEVIPFKLFFGLLEKALPGKTSEQNALGPTCRQFMLDLSALPLRGTGKPVPCLAIQTSDESVRKCVAQFQDTLKASLSFVFQLSPGTNFTNVAPQRVCAVPTADFHAIVNAKVPLDAFAQLARRSIGVKFLVPYTVGAPAEGGMFFGRQGELQSLSDHSDTHYAIVGPSGIGKSSLLLQYMRLNRARRYGDCLYLNMLACSRDANWLTQRLAMLLDSSRRAYRTSAADLAEFLANRRESEGGRTELLLDEVDDYCGTPAFENLANIAKMGLMRLVLCGRGGLLDYILHARSSFSWRLEVLRPGALQLEAARKLLTTPMNALGFIYESPELIEHICEMTGCLPLLLQRYAASLAEQAIGQDTSTITSTMVNAVDSDFDTISLLMRPISELEDVKARALGVALLRHEQSSFSPDEVAYVVRSAEIDLGSRNIFDLCNVLCMQGVLVMDESRFRIANGAIRKLSRESGFLDLLD